MQAASNGGGGGAASRRAASVGVASVVLQDGAASAHDKVLSQVCPLNTKECRTTGHDRTNGKQVL